MTLRHRDEQRQIASWVGALASIAAVTALGSLAGLNPSAIGFVFLIVILCASMWGGLLLGTVMSVLATLCYNFFFFPPVYTLTIAEPANWFALAAFLVASASCSWVARHWRCCSTHAATSTSSW